MPGKIIRFFFLLIFLVSGNLFAKQETAIRLMPSSNPVPFVIQINCPEKIEKRILESRGTKMEVYVDKILINNNSYEIKSVNTRGNNTLKFRRKSFSISLKENIDFNGVPVGKFATNNLAMDKNYWRNRFCFLLMKDINLFPLENSFAEVIINDESQGVYLMVQKPDDFVKGQESPLLVRVNYKNAYEVDYSADKNSKNYLKLFSSRGRITRKFSGKELYDSLNRIMDLKQYYDWLAFNYLVMNGDYTDEIYFYFNPEEERFGIIPWDYDDVFAAQPHEGWNTRNSYLKGKAIFSSESFFDVIISKDEFLYEKYLEEFMRLLEIITEAKLKSSFEKIYQELYPLYQNDKAIGQAQYDQSGPTNLANLEKDLNYHYAFLVNRHKILKQQIAGEIKEIEK